MHILFFIANFPGFGGIEKVTQVLANSFIEKGYEVSFLCFKTTHKGATSEGLNKKITLLYTPDQHNLFCEKNKNYVNTELFSKKYDSVIYQDSYVPDFFSLIDKGKLATRNFSFIVAEHNTPICHILPFTQVYRSTDWSSFKSIIKTFCYPLLKILQLPKERTRRKQLYQFSDFYILLSKQYFLSFIKLIQIPFNPQKIRAIANPLTISPIKETTSEKAKKCLFVARLEYDKGIDLLLKIWKKFFAQRPDYTLQIIGQGKYFTYLQELILKQKIKGVELVGAVADVTPYYKNASMLLLTSRFEGWGLVLTEAMSFKCIPIAFHTYGALTDIITHQETGFIIPPFNTTKYVQTMNFIASSNLLNEMRNKAYQKALTYQIQNILPLWEKIL